jgi:hypothetical protein
MTGAGAGALDRSAVPPGGGDARTNRVSLSPGSAVALTAEEHSRQRSRRAHAGAEAA